MTIFGVHLEGFSQSEVLRQVEAALHERRSLRIATVNPEYLLEARKNKGFRENLRSAGLRVIDGVGIVLVAWLMGEKLTRYQGADLLHDILYLAEKKGIPVGLAIKEDGLSSFDEIKKALRDLYPALRIQREIPAKYAVVFCNYGAPKQEFFLENLYGTQLSMGVGGAFDYLTGKLPRAPRVLRKIGLEWVWRLSLQPRRFGRIWKAVILFPILALFEKR